MPRDPLKTVWVYSKSKKDPDGYKARVVMQGFLMKQGLHYNDVHASVPAVASFRAFMVGVASRGRNLEHWDVKTAFLTTRMSRPTLFFVTLLLLKKKTQSNFICEFGSPK